MFRGKLDRVEPVLTEAVALRLGQRFCVDDLVFWALEMDLPKSHPNRCCGKLDQSDPELAEAVVLRWGQ